MAGQWQGGRISGKELFSHLHCMYAWLFVLCCYTHFFSFLRSIQDARGFARGLSPTDVLKIRGYGVLRVEQQIRLSRSTRNAGRTYTSGPGTDALGREILRERRLPLRRRYRNGGRRTGMGQLYRGGRT